MSKNNYLKDNGKCMVNQIVDFAPKLKKLLNECGSSFKFTCLDAYITQVEFLKNTTLKIENFHKFFIMENVLVDTVI